MTRREALHLSLSGIVGLPAVGKAAQEPAADVLAMAAQVREAERAFAKTMADRDHAAFAGFVSEEAVFIGGASVFRGRAGVAEGWKRYFEGLQAPFSWDPEQVEAVASGLALSSGPVFSPDGKRVGTFNSVWRRETSGLWKVLFDKGCPPCRCE